MFLVKIVDSFISESDSENPQQFTAGRAVEIAEQWNLMNPGAPAIVYEDDQMTVFWADPTFPG